ncbi:MAG: protein-glutamate O-methyltransferase CheR [Myxococcales bacterium]|nr:protein-glutamate O-methyltransferase CheR [Myxococcales bacterium]
MIGLQPLLLSDEEFHRIRALVERHAGLQLDGSRKQLVCARLGGRIRALGLSSFASYCERAATDPRELEYLIGALTTHVTSFFREAHHFEFLRRTCAPVWEREHHRPLRLLSAGCSSGQEPYSIAMTLRDALHAPRARQPCVVAWDIDQTMVDAARTGVYSQKQVAELSEEQRTRHFYFGTGRMRGKYKIKPKTAQLVTFQRANLLGAWPETESYDAIFCRNVLIYFSRARALTLCRRFADRLTPDGFLFLGHSEGITELRDVLEPVGTSVYRARTGQQDRG